MSLCIASPKANLSIKYTSIQKCEDVSIVIQVHVRVCTIHFLESTLYFLLFIIFLKVLQQVKALREMKCVSVTAGQDHTVVVTDE